MPRKICETCCKEFLWRPSQTLGIYCCRDCQIIGYLKKKIDSGTYTRDNSKTYFKRTTEYKCQECGTTEWQGKKLPLQIDHIDGNNTNNLIDNLRYLCPNCHSQTHTWGVKNVSEEGRKRMNEGGNKGRISRKNHPNTDRQFRPRSSAV
jgi:5-methylcytosine-specific restriction endonuclease McrA